jgi:hypothetical protein
MRMSKIVFLLAAMAFGSIGGLGGTWIYAQQQRLAEMRQMFSPQDYLEIQQLYYLYSRDVDPGSNNNASRLYTPDGVFDPGNAKHVGEKALRDFYANVREMFAAGERHLTSNLIIVPTKEGAHTSSYMIQVERLDEGLPVQITLFGKYEDDLVKTPAGWRFKTRVWRSDSHRKAPKPAQ